MKLSTQQRRALATIMNAGKPTISRRELDAMDNTRTSLIRLGLIADYAPATVDAAISTS